MKDRTTYKWKKKHEMKNNLCLNAKTKLNTTTEYAWCCGEYGIRENFPTICNMMHSKKNNFDLIVTIVKHTVAIKQFRNAF